MDKKLIKNTIMLYALNIAKMIFPLLTLPYLTRILSVETYGMIAYVKSVMQYMQLTVDFGFMLSGTKDIVESKENPQKMAIEIGDILIARILLSVICFGGLIILGGVIPILHENFLYTLISFIPVFLTCFLFDYLFRGIEQMEIITIRFVIMKGLSCILTFIMVKGDSNIFWIPALDILGSILAIMWVLNSIKKMKIKVAFSNVRNVLNKLQKSAIYFVSNIATTAFTALNTLLIGIYLNASDVAYWSICTQIIAAVQMLYSPIIDSIYPRMVKTKNIKFVSRLLCIFMPLIIVGGIITIVFSKTILWIVGGKQYIDAALILCALVPILLISFPTMIFGWPTLGVIGKQKEVTLSTIVSAIFQFVGLGVLIILNMFTLINIAVLRCVSEAIMFLFRLKYLMKNRRLFY